jgi:hypothetical protein
MTRTETRARIEEKRLLTALVETPIVQKHKTSERTGARAFRPPAEVAVESIEDPSRVAGSEKS